MYSHWQLELCVSVSLYRKRTIRRIAEKRAVWHRLTAYQVVPVGSWTMSCDHSTKVWLGHSF